MPQLVADLILLLDFVLVVGAVWIAQGVVAPVAEQAAKAADLLATTIVAAVAAAVAAAGTHAAHWPVEAHMRYAAAPAEDCLPMPPVVASPAVV